MPSLLVRSLFILAGTLLLDTAALATGNLSDITPADDTEPQSSQSIASPIVRGTVRTSTGLPLEKATVALHPLLGRFEEGRRLLTTAHGDPTPAVTAQTVTARTVTAQTVTAQTVTVQTAADGRFELRAPGLGMWRLEVAMPGFVPVEVSPFPLVEDRELPPVSLHLDVEASIEVQDPSEAPVPGVQVLAKTSADSPARPLSEYDLRQGWRPAQRHGQTDENGQLRLPRSAGEWLDLTVIVPWSSIPQEIRAVEGMRLLLEPVSPPRRLIQVRNPDGEPLPDVLVSLGEVGWPVGITDALGRLELAGRFTRRQQIQLWDASGRRRAAWMGPGSEPVKAALPAGVEMEGRVVDAQRKGLSHALVWLGHDPGRPVLTDGEGRYRLGITRGEGVWVQAEATGFLTRGQKVETAMGKAAAPGNGAPWPGPVLALTAASGLDGWIVDSEGRPVPGAEVTAAVTDLDQRAQIIRNDPAADRTRSGTDGGFRLARLQAGIRHDLTVVREGFGSRTVTVEWPQILPSSGKPSSGELSVAPERLQIILVPLRAAYAFGRVVDLEELPIAGAEVRLRPAGDERERMHQRALEKALEEEDPFVGISDETGRFELSALPSSTVDLVAGAPGFASLVVPGISLPAQGAEIDLGTVVLERGATLGGRVVDPEGVGIAGIGVWQITELGNSPNSALGRLGGAPPQVETAVDGSFELNDLAAGSQHHLLFHGDGYLTDWRRGVAAPPGEPLTVVLRAGGKVRGRVIDEQGQPIAEGRVAIQPARPTVGNLDVHSHSEHARIVLTDEKGAFEIDTVAPGRYEAEAFATAYQPSQLLSLEVKAGETLDRVEFVLLRGATLQGWVRTTEGEPVGSARVMVGQPAAITDSEGFYRVEGIPPGDRMVEVRHRIFNRERREIAIEPGVNTLDMVLKSGHAVTGQVLDEEDRPVSQVQITLMGGREYHDDSTTTGADGTFSFPQVAEGTYRLRATKGGYAPTDLPDAFEIVDAPVEDFEVRLLPGAVIVGEIRGLEIDELAQLEIIAHSPAASGRRGQVDYGGRYKIRDLGSGEWQVRASLPGGRREADGWVSIQTSDREVTLNLEFGSGAVLSGTVLHNGDPLAGALVSTVGHDVNVSRQVRTDYEGRFEMEDVPLGQYRIDASHPRELLVHNLDLHLTGDQEIMIEIDTAQVSGRVTSAQSGAPITDAVVALQRSLGTEASRDGGMFTVGTDAEGQFRLARITHGVYRLTVRRDGYETHERTLELVGDTEALELGLTPTEGLDLIVQMVSGERPPFVTVNVLDDAGQLLVAESRPVDEAGRVRFPTVPPGSWHLLVAAPGSAPTRAVATTPGEPLALMLPEGKRLTVRVPALVSSRQAASVSLLGIDGQPFVGLGTSGDVAQTMWRLTGGAAVVQGVPVGQWIVQVTSADGQTWSGPVDVTAEGNEIRLK